MNAALPLKVGVTATTLRRPRRREVAVGSAAQVESTTMESCGPARTVCPGSLKKGFCRDPPSQSVTAYAQPCTRCLATAPINSPRPPDAVVPPRSVWQTALPIPVITSGPEFVTERTDAPAPGGSVHETPLCGGAPEPRHPSDIVVGKFRHTGRHRRRTPPRYSQVVQQTAASPRREST